MAMTDQDLSWMLDDIVNHVPKARHAVLLSADGLPRGSTAGTDEQSVRTISAAMAGMQSLSRATAHFAGHSDDPRWKQTVIEFSHGWLFLIAAGQGAYLAAAAAPDVDMEQISFRMHQLVARLGKDLTSPPRTTATTQTRERGERHVPDTRHRTVVPGLDDVVSEVPGARHALLLTADGLPRGATSGMSQNLADTISAAMTGMQSLSRATALFAGPDEEPQWKQTVIEFSHGWIFLMSAGHGACLAAAAAPETDIGDITARMHQLMPRLSPYLASTEGVDTR
jgi:predicted regulator of Ras-like GTPase activity (Roadblock/LC7/MglB family)